FPCPGRLFWFNPKSTSFIPPRPFPCGVMPATAKPTTPEVFISYASRNRDRVVPIARHLESAGVTIWRDQDEILGGENYGPKIVEGIKRCKLLMLMCTDASMRSKNVKQEIQLAWHFGRPYLPLLVEP